MLDTLMPLTNGLAADVGGGVFAMLSQRHLPRDRRGGLRHHGLPTLCGGPEGESSQPLVWFYSDPKPG